MNDNSYKLGIDIGSTTIKLVCLDMHNNVVFDEYKRHFASIKDSFTETLSSVKDKLGECIVQTTITGSGGLSLSKNLKIPFVQEVIAVSKSIKHKIPEIDVAIELGGEDAKILYFENENIDQRMNGICAGGTGAFIDQMASLLKTDAAGLNELAKSYTSTYPIASRCGVFAKTDIQPLINDGAKRENIAASIFESVVKQTISGLSCGKPIKGKVCFLGGPLHFLDQLRLTFQRILNLSDTNAVHPENSHLFAAYGAALNKSKEIITFPINKLIKIVSSSSEVKSESQRLAPLFDSEIEYEKFKDNHASAKVESEELSTYKGDCYLGIDAGSTTTKIALISNKGKLLHSFYSNNEASPVKTTCEALKSLYKLMPEGAVIKASACTGYGESLIRTAFNIDYGQVETYAHYKASSFFNDKVDFILDIGGQDMKCMKIKNGVISSVILNEACSAGCGSFIDNFATSLNYNIQDFAKIACLAKEPIDLGSRCTVFMNSNVKQAQKEGVSVADISAGLSYSVVKNALYKVIKISSAKELGKNIVVQGGTFYNDSVLKAFETLTQSNVTRPNIAGIMGAFGSALIAKEKHQNYSNMSNSKSNKFISLSELEDLKYSSELKRCNLCTNNCALTINTFSHSKKHISGNRCERPLSLSKIKEEIPNIYNFKYKRVFDYKQKNKNFISSIGIPRTLNMYENYPFWFTFFDSLGFKVIISPPSSKKIAELAMESIPSETVCYPAKLAHGHIKSLINMGVKNIFYPCVYYERIEDKNSQNNYNCPVVTSYPENIRNNMDEISSGGINFISPFISFESHSIIENRLIKLFSNNFTSKEIITAVNIAWMELIKYKSDIKEKGKEILNYIEKNNKRAIVLAGRPYHIDPEINHGIDQLIESFGIGVLSEDSIDDLAPCPKLRVLNQWSYHSRLYRAAKYVSKRDDLELIQLNSFGCGIDAIISEQIEEILRENDKIYTLLKIDEISNLGAAKIRFRSLLAALGER